MIFKSNWEKTATRHEIEEEIIVAMIQQAYPNKNIESYEVIEGGCINFNIKFKLKERSDLLLLRIYMRDGDAAYKEKSISELLQQEIPVAKVYYVGSASGYNFAIYEYINGITLRDLLLSNEPYDLTDIMQQVAIILSKIASHKFVNHGFFDKDLNVTDNIDQDSYFEFA